MVWQEAKYQSVPQNRQTNVSCQILKNVGGFFIAPFPPALVASTKRGFFAQMRRRRGSLSRRLNGLPNGFLVEISEPSRFVNSVQVFLVNTDVPTRNPTRAASNPSLRRTNRRLSNAHSKRAQFRRCVRASTKCRLDYGHNYVCAIPMPLAAQPLVLLPADIEGRCGSVCDNKRWSDKTNVNRDGLG